MQKYFITNRSIIKSASVILCLLWFISSNGQYNWRLSKDKDGIKVYTSSTNTSKYKSVKVECTIEGTYDRLIAVLNDVNHHKDWIYSNKMAYLLKVVSPLSEFYYYTETNLPWPQSNRDAAIHLTITRDSLNRFLKVSAVSVPDYVPEKTDKVRVTKSLVNWYVTSSNSSTLNIVYVIEADPGGSPPPWLVNMFIDKGPFESFKNLKNMLKK